MTTDFDSLLHHRAAVRRVAMRLVAPGDVDDVVQETWLQAVRNPPRGEPLPWLIRVLQNVVRSRRRGEARRRIHEAEHARSRPPGEGAGLDAALIEMEAVERVSAALRGLPEPYRSTLIRRDFHGQSTARIAAEDQVSEAAVRQRVHRGLELLRSELARERDGRPGMSDRALGAAFGISSSGLKASPPLAASAALAATIMKATHAVWVAAIAVIGLAVWQFSETSDAHRPVAQPEESPGTATQSVADTTDRVESRLTTADSKPLPREALPAAVIDPNAHGSLQLTFRWTDDRSPASGIVVFLIEDTTGRRRRSVTRANGVAAFDELTPGTFRVSGFFRAPYRTENPRSEYEVAAGEPTRHEFHIDRGATVAGRVVDEQGEGIAGARVLAAGWSANWARHVETTDRAGQFELLGVQNGLSIGAVADGFVASKLQQLTAGEQGRAEPTITLNRASANLVIRILDDAGAPIPGARVAVGELGRQNNPEPSALGVDVMTIPELHLADENGMARIGGVAPGELPFEVRASGYGSVTDSFEIPVGTTTAPETIHTVTLRAGVTLAGRITDGNGAPMEDVHVEFGRHGHLARASVSTDADGRYRLKDLPAGELLIVAQKRGRRLKHKVRAGPGDTLRWDGEYPPERTLRGVLRHGNGEPAQGPISFWSKNPYWHGYTYSAEDGSYEVGIAEGVASIRVTASSQSPFEREIYRGPVPAGNLDLALGENDRRSATIRGRLVDSNGQPVADAQLWYGLRGQGNATIIELNEDGTFESPMSPGAYRLRVEASGFAQLRTETDLAIGETRDLGELRLEPPAAMTVELTMPDAIPDSMSFWLTNVERNQRSRVMIRSGKGEIGGLPEGRYRLQVIGPGIAQQIREIFLPANETTIVAIAAQRGVPLEYAIVTAEGVEAPSHVELTVESQAGVTVVRRRSSLRSTGELYGDHALAPGVYTATLRAGELSATQSIVVNASDESVTVSITLQ